MRIKELRTQRGIRQQELADALGISQVAVARWETGVAYPSADKLPKIAEVLGCGIGDLYAGDPPRQTEAVS